MGVLRQLLGGYLLSRLLNRNRRRGYGARRGQVHVTGCCLPIPCGTAVGLTAATGLAIHRARR